MDKRIGQHDQLSNMVQQGRGCGLPLAAGIELRSDFSGESGTMEAVPGNALDHLHAALFKADAVQGTDVEQDLSQVVGPDIEKGRTGTSNVMRVLKHWVA